MLDRIHRRFLAFKYAGNKNRFQLIHYFFLLYDLIMHSSSDFILRIAPLRQKDHSIRYYPPPGYGLPAGKQFISMDSHAHEFSQYGLFLFPGKIMREFFIPFVFISSAILLPIPYLIKSLEPFKSYSAVWITLCIWLIGLAMLLAFAHIIMHWIYRRIPPLFPEVWQLWPESQYKLFTTVPHRVRLARKDKKVTPALAEKYWNPDNNTPMLHQSSEYAKRSNTVQEVLMHLAIFEFFFKNYEGNNSSQKDEKNEKKQGLDSLLGVMESLKIANWFIYYLAPVWIAYFMMIIAMFVYPIFVNKSSFTGLPVLISFPNNLVLAGFLWLFFSYFFIVKRIQYLQNLHKDIKDGLYDLHLELVPQKIISSITQIPHEKHIFSSIQYMQKALYILQIFAFANLMMILEVFSQSYGG